MAEEPPEKTQQARPQEESASSDPLQQEEMASPVELPTAISQEQRSELNQQNAERHDWIEQLGAQDRRVSCQSYQRMADWHMSTTDPDASMMVTKGGSHLGYQTHYVVDGGKSRIILNVLVAPKARLGKQTHARLALAGTLSVEAVARASHRGQQVRDRREHCCHRKPTYPCLHSPS